MSGISCGHGIPRMVFCVGRNCTDKKPESFVPGNRRNRMTYRNTRQVGDTMNIGFIGAGKVGFTLGKFFSEGGIHVTGYYSRHIESAEEAAAFTNSKAYRSIREILQDSDALFLTVPDGMITSVYEELKKWGLSGKQICHCSGALSVPDAFPGLADTGACGYSIHPLFPISSKLNSYRELTDAFFCLEGDETHIRAWAQLLNELGARTQIIAGEAKVRYHAACAISSNLVCALAQESIDLLESCGMERSQALRALAPLMRSNLEHLIQHGPAAALTGAVERNDTATVEKHLHCFPTEAERELYRACSEKLVQLAERKNPDRDYRRMEAILQ